MKKQIKEKLKSACEESERKERVEKVAKILESVKYPDETTRLEAVLAFSRSSMTEAEIERIMAPGKPEYMQDQLTKRGLY